MFFQIAPPKPRLFQWRARTASLGATPVDSASPAPRVFKAYDHKRVDGRLKVVSIDVEEFESARRQNASRAERFVSEAI